MIDNISGVDVIEQDLLMTVEDFANQEGVTPRTVYRWIELGRLDVVERLGKKYVNASVPPKRTVIDSDNDGHDTKSKNVGALQQVNIFEEYLKTLRENGKRYEKSCRRWQMSCFAGLFMFVIALMAATALSLLYHYGIENMNNKLDVSASELARAESEKAAALAKLDEFNQQVELKVQPYKEENARLQQRVDDLIARNDGLRDRLDQTFDRNAVLLQTMAEKETIDAPMTGTPSLTMNTSEALELPTEAN